MMAVFELSWQLQSRFDGRAALDSIPEYVGGAEQDLQSESREEKNERKSVNYER